MYREPNFSSADVGKMFLLSDRKIVELVLKNTNYGFKEYINHIRVEKAKSYLKDAKYENYTNLAIGFECGFNSKSTFYRDLVQITCTNSTHFKSQN